jgi:hypothetical protein
MRGAWEDSTGVASRGWHSVSRQSPIACHADLSRHSCGVGGSGARRQVDVTLLASISSRLSFVCVAVSETLKQLPYGQQGLSAPVWRRTQRAGDVPGVSYAAASRASRS